MLPIPLQLLALLSFEPPFSLTAEMLSVEIKLEFLKGMILAVGEPS